MEPGQLPPSQARASVHTREVAMAVLALAGCVEAWGAPAAMVTVIRLLALLGCCC
jgi:hypothetical protein